MGWYPLEFDARYSAKARIPRALPFHPCSFVFCVKDRKTKIDSTVCKPRVYHGGCIVTRNPPAFFRSIGFVGPSVPDRSSGCAAACPERDSVSRGGNDC